MKTIIITSKSIYDDLNDYYYDDDGVVDDIGIIMMYYYRYDDYGIVYAA
jgi:hypothetical protein